MIQVSLDTSFLISFADPERANHAVAVEYFRHCLASRIPMWLSVVAAGEFEVGQPVSDLPLKTSGFNPTTCLMQFAPRRCSALYARVIPPHRKTAAPL
jgi:hypothetical protein